MSLVSSIISGLRWKLFSKFVTAITGGILTIVLARVLEPDGYGLLFFAFSIISILSFVSNLGFGRSASRYVSEFKVSDPGQVWHVIRFATLFISISTGTSVILLGVFHVEIAELVNNPDVAPLLLLGTIFLAFSTLYSYVDHLLQGFEEMKLISIANIVNSVGTLLAAGALVIFGFGAFGGMLGYAIGYALSFFTAFILLYVFVYPNYDHEEEPTPGLPRRIFEYNIPIIATKSGSLLSKTVDTLLVGFFLGPAAVGFYTLGEKIVKMVETPVSALGYTLAPAFGSAKADENIEGISRVFEQSVLYTLALYLPAASGIALLAEPMVEYIFGSDYLGAVLVIQLFTVYLIMNSLMKYTSAGLDFLGRARERAIIKTVTSVANVGLNLLLIPTIGVEGAVLATLLTYGTYSLLNLYIMHKELEIEFGRIRTQLTYVLVITLVMSIVVMFVRDYIGGIVSLFSVVILGMMVVGILSYLTGLFDRRLIERFIRNDGG